MRGKLSTIAYIFLFLIAFIFWQYVFNKDEEENHLSRTETSSQNKHHPTILPAVPSDRHTSNSLCSFQPVSPEEAAEEKLLLQSIAWPETPPFSSLPSLDDTSDPAHSTFIILPKRGGRGGGQWHVGDQLEVLISIRDFQGHPKKYGGDFLLAKLHGPDVDGGVTGRVKDHLNGSYTAVFPLLWTGRAQVQVTLIHSSEAISVLRWLDSEHPFRIYYRSRFKSGEVSETTVCHVCLPPSQQPLCDYTDPRTGEPWFCYKPKTLSCDSRISHNVGNVQKHTTPREEALFQPGVNLKVFIRASGPAEVTVLPKREDQPEVTDVTSGVPGYYYQGVWKSLGDTPVKQFNTPAAISQCLKNKMVHIYGDSTAKQWFLFLAEVLPDLKEFTLPYPEVSGPRLMLDFKSNIMVTYRAHGPPILFDSIPSGMDYIANDLDTVPGGANTVIVLSVWAHFTTVPIQIYIRRMMIIRRAVVRLLTRAPDTVVIVRTANLRDNLDFRFRTLSDWSTMQRDRALRAVMKGVKVHLVDAIEMTVAHKLPHGIHPQPPIIKNMIDIALTHICS